MKVIAYIDGFNLYHSIRGLNNPRLKWCNINKLVSLFLGVKDELIEIRFYTASPHHCDEDVQGRFKKYIAALETEGIKILYGRFQKKKTTVGRNNINLLFPQEKHASGKMRYCKLCPVIYSSPKAWHYQVIQREEKETDVNLAVDLVVDAYQDRYEKSVVISADSDFQNAMSCALERNKKILLLSPPFQKARKYRHMAQKYKNLSVRSIERKHIGNAVFSEVIYDAKGAPIDMPEEYRQTPPLV